MAVSWVCALGPEPGALRHPNRKRLDCFSVLPDPNHAAQSPDSSNNTQESYPCQPLVLISFIQPIAVLDLIEVIRMQAWVQARSAAFCGR